MAVFLALLLASAPLSAQDQPDNAAEPDLDTLMAPVALFPDPLLAAVLQASVVPLDVVKASRFLDSYAQDPSATPDPNWDPAVLGLLAFPTVLKGMNEHLDWVQTVGDAVVQRLPDVQDSIQQVRAEFYASGVLKSDDKQRIEVDQEVIRITPTDQGKIFVPVYDPQALIAAVEASRSAAATTGEATDSGPPPPTAAPAQAAAGQPPAEIAAPTAEAPPAPPAAPAQEAPAPPATETVPPVAPASYAAPVTYAAPVAYPAATGTTSSLWPAVGGFAGGALVGGILGYAIGDDDDDDHDHDDGWHSDLDEDDLNDVVDRIDDDRDDARRERQDYQTSSREDRQSFENQAREDRQQSRSDAATQRQDGRAQQEQVRRAHTDNAQAQLASRAQGIQGSGASTRATRRTPSPTAIQAVPSPSVQRATPKFSQASQKASPSAVARSLPRQATASAAASAPRRAGDTRVAGIQRSALSGIDRGATVKRQEVRGAQSRQVATRSAPSAGRAVAAKAQRPQIERSRPAAAQRGPGGGGGQHALKGAGGGGGRGDAARGRQSRHR